MVPPWIDAGINRCFFLVSGSNPVRTLAAVRTGTASFFFLLTVIWIVIVKRKHYSMWNCYIVLTVDRDETKGTLSIIHSYTVL